jgi:hypothetical protein
VITDVRGERRFISTIAGRLDALGALTKGQRQTGGQGLFQAKDNLESIYAQMALETLFRRMANQQVPCCSLSQFEAATGLSLRTEQGRLKDELPDIPTFLNRVLALTIQMQNSLFEVFEELLEANIEAAIAKGIFEVGVETVRAEHINLINQQTVYTHSSGSQTTCVEIELLNRNPVRSVESALSLGGQLVINQRSKRSAVCVPTTSIVCAESGAFIPRVKLIFPAKQEVFTHLEYQKTTWQESSLEEWQEQWQAEVDLQPPFLSTRCFLICGLLLPIWNLLGDDLVKVWRVKTDAGEQFLGREVIPQEMTRLVDTLGLHQVSLTPDEIYKLVTQQNKSYPLPSGLVLRLVTVMQEKRLEITADSIPQSLSDRLKSVGVFTEIISWKTRYFIPNHEVKAPKVIEGVQALF